MRIQEVGDRTFAREVIRADRTVLVHFFTASCQRSLALGPIVEAIATDMSTDVKVVRIDVKRSPKLAARLGVRRFPTQMLFVDGVMTDQILGDTTAETLRDMVKTGVDARKKALASLQKAGTKAGEIIDANFGRSVLQSDVPVMAVFWSRACAASLKLLEHVNEATASQKTSSKVKVKVVPVQAKLVPEARARLGVTRLPMTLVFNNGEVVDTIGGVLSPASIAKVLRAPV